MPKSVDLAAMLFCRQCFHDFFYLSPFPLTLSPDLEQEVLCSLVSRRLRGFNQKKVMQIQDYFNFLASDDIRIQGSRIGIESVLYEYIYRAKTPEEIAQQFESITLEQVYATILYYLQNQEEIKVYLADWLEFSRQQRQEQKRNPSPARQRFRQLKAQADVPP